MTRGKLALWASALMMPIPQDAPSLDEGWLDVDTAAVVEVTSEEKENRAQGTFFDFIHRNLCLAPFRKSQEMGWRLKVGIGGFRDQKLL
jgi:hypothetical protein